jgi:hypothetical protein
LGIRGWGLKVRGEEFGVEEFGEKQSLEYYQKADGCKLKVS